MQQSRPGAQSGGDQPAQSRWPMLADAPPAVRLDRGGP